MDVTVYAHGKRLRALLDSGAGRTFISNKAVEKYDIPYRRKEKPLTVGLADDMPMTYGGGTVRLETEEIRLQVGPFQEWKSYAIMDLGEYDMFVGHDWLRRHNPDIDWVLQTLTKRQPATKIARVRQESRSRQKKPTLKIGRISAKEIEKIYRKNPKQLGVIWVRRTAPQNKGGERPRIPKEYAEWSEL